MLFFLVRNGPRWGAALMGSLTTFDHAPRAVTRAAGHAVGKPGEKGVKTAAGAFKSVGGTVAKEGGKSMIAGAGRGRTWLGGLGAGAKSFATQQGSLGKRWEAAKQGGSLGMDAVKEHSRLAAFAYQRQAQFRRSLRNVAGKVSLSETRQREQRLREDLNTIPGIFEEKNKK